MTKKSKRQPTMREVGFDDLLPRRRSKPKQKKLFTVGAKKRTEKAIKHLVAIGIAKPAKVEPVATTKQTETPVAKVPAKIQTAAEQLAKFADQQGMTVKGVVDLGAKKLIGTAWLWQIVDNAQVIALARQIESIESLRLHQAIERHNAKHAPNVEPPVRVDVPRSTTATVFVDQTKQPDKAKLFGHAITAIIRWMGSEAWSAEQVDKVLAHYGHTMAPATVRWQLRAGRNEARPVPKLTDEQTKELDDLLRQHRGEPKPVVAPPVAQVSTVEPPQHKVAPRQRSAKGGATKATKRNLSKSAKKGANKKK